MPSSYMFERRDISQKYCNNGKLQHWLKDSLARASSVILTETGAFSFWE